jgi:hypothetical protein
MEVISGFGEEWRVRFTSPWNSADWTLQRANQRYFLTGYGDSSLISPVTPIALLFDFGGASEATSEAAWSNGLGSFAISSNARFSFGETPYTNAISIQQIVAGGQNTFTFAPGVGLIRVVTGGQTFDLDAASSTLPSVSATDPSALPLPPIGLISNNIASKAYSTQDVVNQVASISGNGVRFLMGYGRWRDLEPVQAHFALDSLRFQVSESNQLNLAAAYTLCLIDMGIKNVPPELMNLRWKDPVMLARVDALVTALAGEFQGRVAWLQVGNEVDTYFGLHPNEVADYAVLLQEVRRQLAAIAPQVKVSVTVEAQSINQLSGSLAPLNKLSDLLVVTYGAYNSDFTVKSPTSPDADIPALVAAAGSRNLLFQEISFPSAAANGSSPETQATVLQRVFDNLRIAGGKVAAANFYIYADYTPQNARHIATSAGLGSSSLFVTFMESLGMFDLNGNPKPSWTTFVTALRQ